MILQNVLFENEICGVKEMLFRELPDGQSFDTYFNLFSYARWKEYTNFQTLFLSVKADGNGKVCFYDENRTMLFEAVVSGGKAEHIPIPTDLGCLLLYLCWYPEKPGSRLISAAFETSDPARQEVRIAVDICTYRREEFVKKNLKVLSGLEDVFTYVADNGNTLNKEELESEKVKVFPNLNSGGSGGFTRGMLEVLKDKEARKLTHILLMDDDVRFLPETFVRLKALLSLRTEKYRNACVSGAFLNSEVGYALSEGGSEWKDLRSYARIFNLNLDLREFDANVKNEREYVSDHAAWWFACYSLETVREDNLPLPFFIRLDDSEYGKRAGVPVLRLNGICVWHEASENKKDSSLYYYTIRNMLILNAVHHTPKSRGKMYGFCVRSMLSNLLRYRYKDMGMVMRAAEDFLKGPVFFEETDPSSYHQEIRKQGYTLKDVHELTEDPEVLHEVECFDREKDLKTLEKRSLKHILTLNGWLLPAKKDRVYAFPLSVSQEQLCRKGKVLFFDSSNGKGMLAQKEYRGLGQFLLNCLKLLVMFGKYSRAYEAFYQKKTYLTGKEFWKKYLKLEDQT